MTQTPSRPRICNSYSSTRRSKSGEGDRPAPDAGEPFAAEGRTTVARGDEDVLSREMHPWLPCAGEYRIIDGVRIVAAKAGSGVVHRMDSPHAPPVGLTQGEAIAAEARLRRMFAAAHEDLEGPATQEVVDLDSFRRAVAAAVVQYHARSPTAGRDAEAARDRIVPDGDPCVRARGVAERMHRLMSRYAGQVATRAPSGGAAVGDVDEGIGSRA